MTTDIESLLAEVQLQNSELRAAQVAIAQVEEELRKSEARFRLIAEHVEDVFVIHERATRSVSYVSPAFVTIWGRPVDDFYNGETPWFEWVHPEDRDRIRKGYEAVYDGVLFNEIHRIHRPDGELRWIRARAFPILEEDGAVHRDVVVFQDITAEHQLEEELHQAQKMEAVGALASGIAHDFNNVLQGILGCINLARGNGISTERAQQFLDHAAEAARRGGDLAGHLMAFTRKRGTNPRPIAFDSVITDSANVLGRLLTERIDLQIDTDASGFAILADAVQIEQILMNLAANARDAMPDGGTLSIRSDTVATDTFPLTRHGLGDASRYVRLTVEDSGVGIDDKIRSRVFEPFFTTKQAGKGTGLGLASVFVVTKQLGGHVEVDSEPGEGTSFTLYFPCCEQGPRPPRPCKSKTAALTGTALLVEDDPLIRSTVGQILGDLGLEVIEAKSPDESQDLLARHDRPLELLVSDVNLPGMNGAQLAAALRQRFPKLHVLFMSADLDMLVSDELPDDPIELLRKPFDKDALSKKLHDLMG